MNEFPEANFGFTKNTKKNPKKNPKGEVETGTSHDEMGKG
jgi:hypothetical protein